MTSSDEPSDETFDAEQTATRRDEVVRHMLTTPPKTHAELNPPKRPYRRKTVKAASDRLARKRGAVSHA
jgi:hypothetical protein